MYRKINFTSCQLITYHKLINNSNLRQQPKAGLTFGEFAETYYEKVVCVDRKNPLGIRRYLDRDILPVLKNKLLFDVTIVDVQAIVELKKAQGSDAVALEFYHALKGR